MHFIPDTEEEDSAAERFWPEGYKQVLREGVRRTVAEELGRRRRFRRVYRQAYAGRFASYEDFLGRLADMVTVGAENGADSAFDEIIDAFLAEEALPPVRRYARYQWPQAITPRLRQELRRVIADEYGQDDVYRFAYEKGYYQDYPSLEEYLGHVADLVTAGAENGANDVLEGAYRQMMRRERFLPVRRYPRRLKMW